MTQEPSENIKEGFKTFSRIKKQNKQTNRQKTEKKHGEKIQNDIVTRETTTTKEVY